MTVASLPAPPRRHGGDGPRWIVSAGIVVLLHVAAMIAAATWQVGVERVAPPPPAIIIDLPPEPVAPPAEPAPPPPVLQPPPLKPPPLEPPPPRPAVALPKPPPPRPVRRPVEPPPVAVPPPAAPAAPQAPAATPPRPAASPTAISDFQRALISHLEMAKRYPREAQLRREQGTVYLRFRMDRSGRVLSASVDRGSGYPDLDAEVLQMIQRAQPLPPIPPEIPQNQLELVAPVRFYIR